MGGEFLHIIRVFISNHLVRESANDRGRRSQAMWEGLPKQECEVVRTGTHLHVPHSCHRVGVRKENKCS